MSDEYIFNDSICCIVRTSAVGVGAGGVGGYLPWGGLPTHCSLQ